MKAESTIRREINRLRSMAENDQYTDASRQIAYEAYHALRWVIEEVSWTPRREIGRCMEMRVK